MTLSRQTGLALGVVVFLLWVGLWVVLSGLPGRTVEAVREGFYNKTAEAGFVVNNVLVEGRENTDSDVLLALINVERGDPLFSFHPASAREMIERIAWVKEAHVERRLPDTIYVSLTERKPLALWQNKGRVRLIDREGEVLTERNLKPFSHLMILVGEKAPQKVGHLEMLLAVAPDIQKRIEAATWVGNRRWDLKLKNGAVVRLPEKDEAYALKRLMDSHKAEGLLDKQLKVIDIREHDRIVVRTHPGAVKEYKASVKAGSNI